MAKPGSDRDAAMVDKQAGKKCKDKLSPFTKTPKLDRGELLGKEGKAKSSMKRKLSFTSSPLRTEERDSDTDDSDPGQSTETWGDRLVAPCRIYADKDGPDKKKVKKEAGNKKSQASNLLFGYPLSERKQMALLMQMTANSPDSTPSHPSQTTPVQKKVASSASSRQKDKVNKRNERGETPLHMAAIRGDAKQVKELISLGADVNVKDFAGWTPLHEACNLGYYDVAKVLIAAGAEVNTQGLDDDTPLHDASSSGHKDIVKLLLRNGGNAFQANKRGERPVDVADSPELELLLKGEGQQSDLDDTSSESEDPPSVNPSSVDENMEDTDTEKDSDGKVATKASSSIPGLDEYEFKDDEEEEDLSKALNDRHILRRELRQREKEDKDRNHVAGKQKRDSSSKSKKPKAPRVRCSSDTSSDEMESLPEKRSFPTCSQSLDGHKRDTRSKKEHGEHRDKGKVKRKSKSQNKNKENQEDGKENSKTLALSLSTVCESSEKGREEDSFKMSFSPKDDSSVHLFHLSSTKPSKLNHSLADKQTPLKQENTKTCVSLSDGSCPVDVGKYNHFTDGDYCTEASSTKGCKHKEKSKHQQESGDEGHMSPYKDSSVGNSVDASEGTLRKTDLDGKVVKKHKLKHKEKDKHRRESEAERSRHRPKDGKKDGHRNLEFDREFWKENFFKSDETDEARGLKEMEDNCFPHKPVESSPVKDERGGKEKHSSLREKRLREEREKDKAVKKERKDTPCREEKLKEREEKGDGHNAGRLAEDSLQGGMKEEAEEKAMSTITSEQEQPELSEKTSREKTDRKLQGKEKEPEKTEKKHLDKDRKIKSEHSDRTDNQNSTDRWKEKERAGAGSSLSPGEKSYRENDKLKALFSTRKHEDGRKSKDKFDKRSERDRQDREYGSGDHKEKDRKGKLPDKSSDHSKSDRFKDKDCDRKKRDRIRDVTLSSSSNQKSATDEKRNSLSEGSKLSSARSKEDVVRTPEKERDRRDRDLDRHKDKERHRDRSQQPKSSRAKGGEVEPEKSKSKICPTSRDAKPKEKRLVNDDLMQTSFERMLSMKDQEIELWHRKHLEKIKQKERERLKQRPQHDTGKSKVKDRNKTDSALSKELLRSKSSEASEVHFRDKSLKEATGGRTVSLDGRSLPPINPKVMTAVENCLSRSPRPESERSSLMSRSVSLVSVASSEDSCQAATLTPRNAEYDSDMNPDASDSQPAFLQSSLVIQAASSPSVTDRDSCSLPEVLQSSRTLLSVKHEPPFLRTILDEDANTSADLPPKGLTPITEEGLRVWETSEPEDSAGAPPLFPSAADVITERDTNMAVSLETPPLPSSQDLPGRTAALAPPSTPQPHPAETTPLPIPDDAVTFCPESSMGESPMELDQPSHPTQSTSPTSTEVPALTHTQEGQTDSCQESQQQQQQEDTDSSAPVEQRDRPLECPAVPVQEDTENAPESSPTHEAECSAAPPSPEASSSAAEELSTEANKTASLQEDTAVTNQDEKKWRSSYESADPCPVTQTEEGVDIQGSGQRAEDMSYIPQTSEEDSHPSLDPVSADGSSSPGGSAEPKEEPMDVTSVKGNPDSSVIAVNQSPSSVHLTAQTDSGSSSNSVSGSSSPQSMEQESDSLVARALLQPADGDLDLHVPHPRKRKMPKLSGGQVWAGAPQEKEKGHQSLAAMVDSVKLEEIEPYQTERANPYYEFLHIRRKIEEKRKVLCSVTPQPPQYYDEYVTYNGSYLLDGNPLSKLCIPMITPPPSLPEQLKEMFKQQEVVRMKLRLQHGIEREKLILSNEQEVLRVHYRAARTLANQALPFSACTVLLDAEVYNMPQDVQNDDGKTSVRDRFNARQFMSWLQDVDDKFDKLKTCLLMRQQHEAAALNAVQRLEWQLKLQELDPATYKSTSIFEIPEFYIPLVEVNDDFDLAPI